MAMLVTIRGRLRDDPEAIRKIHDEVTAATKEMALQAGDITHRVYLSPQDGREFLGIDEWKSAEAVQAFSANPQIQEFFGQMFEGAPEVTIWEGAGWNEW
jgi:quinol monooxygenase YgiN